jgi:5-bromo-4-chloroindolyl phosphate hydrolysis protein
MRDNHFVVLVFFSILNLILTTILSSVILSQNSTLKFKIENTQNNNKSS